MEPHVFQEAMARLFEASQTQIKQQGQLLNTLSQELVDIKKNHVKMEKATPISVDIESLANSMQAFTFLHDTESCFEVWYNRYADIFYEDAKHLDENTRVRLLLRKLDALAYERYANYILPKTPKEFSFVDTVATLKKIFGRQESVFHTRWRCLQVNKRESCDFNTYAAEVNRLCEDFSLNTMTPDEFKCLIFILGLKGDRVSDFRVRLLNKLSTEASENVKLSLMLEECNNVANLKRDTALFNTIQSFQSQSTSSAIVNAVQQPKPVNLHKRPPRPCWLCGGMHFTRDCEFSNHKCSICNCVGHRDGYCPPVNKRSNGFQRNKKRNHSGSNKHNSNAIHQANVIRSDRKYVCPIINGQIVEFQFDSAADCSVMKYDTWEKLNSPLLRESSITMNDAQSMKIPLLGEFSCLIQFNGVDKIGRCFVSKQTHENLFGIEWIQLFDLWNKAPSTFCNVIRTPINATASINAIKAKFPDVFSETMGYCTKVTATITLKEGATSIFRPKRPVAFHATAMIDDELQRLQASGILTPTDYSQWAAPIVAARKSNGNIRICGDYSTGLNDAVECHNYPIPSPDDIFTKFANKKIFSRIDLRDAYLQIPVDEQSSKLLTIHTHRGLFKVNRLQPGIKSAPGIFQQCVEMMLTGISSAVPYFDDICVASDNEHEHFDALLQVFERISEFNFRVKIEKCLFFSSELKFLGIIINASGLQPDKEKIQAIQNMPPPKDVSQLRSLLGALQFWGKFIKSMSDLRAPLDNLLKTGVKWNWSEECQQNFQKFKEILSSDLLLTHYNPALPITIAADASSYAIGCVAYHEYPDRTMKAFYHASRSLTNTETKYSQIEKEALGLVVAVKKFHRFIYGRRFKILTDHKPLVSIFGSKNGIPVHTANRLQRWALILLNYDFEIGYTSTDSLGHADILSRLISEYQQPDDEYIIAQIQTEEAIENFISRESTIHLPITFKMAQIETDRSSQLVQVKSYIQCKWPDSLKKCKIETQSFFRFRESLTIIQGCIFYGDRLVVPCIYQNKIMKQLHFAHPGMSRMKSLARSYVFWPGIDGEIEEMVRQCEDCAMVSKSPPKSDPCPWPLSTRPWQRIHIDYAEYDGDNYLLIVDSYSKWPEIYTTSSMTSAATIVKIKDSMARFGNPETIVSDNGTQFTSELFQEFCASFGITHIRTSPYHPSSNGQAERFVDTLKRVFNKLQKHETKEEKLFIFLSQYRYNPNPNAPKGQSPAFSFLGREVRTVFSLLKPFVFSQKSDIDNHPSIRIFQEGETVYAKVYRSGGKFEWKSGTIVQKKGNVNYTVQLGNGKQIHSHVDQIKQRSINTPIVQEQFLPVDIVLTQQPSTDEINLDYSTSNNSSDFIGFPDDDEVYDAPALAQDQLMSPSSSQRYSQMEPTRVLRSRPRLPPQRYSP